MIELDKLRADLERTRDELRLKIHLGSKDAQDRWTDLEAEWKRFVEEAELGRSTERLADAARTVGAELKDAYERLRKAL